LVFGVAFEELGNHAHDFIAAGFVALAVVFEA
jgi:hypothetical protein